MFYVTSFLLYSLKNVRFAYFSLRYLSLRSKKTKENRKKSAQKKEKGSNNFYFSSGQQR